ncbi:pentatricopeptide repeat-containing protein At2g03880, mitochondrial-like [Olea europaea var. sylvestris]|uniref:pentatricopeptide repeat-containing protein At2g03880, mitochondrial-like n=1 Tax=Olea europaea var. sylvestris TaxID=158386 RepID=UPI000C1D6161|nr:pentatricopeptide repeat-containing protein At2g03880, mitochondrial-like [Olea europaea var. sylvestris]
MGCNFASSQMRSPPPLMLCGVLSTFYTVPINRSTLFSGKKPVLYSLRFQSSHCAAVLKTCERAGGDFISVKSPNFRLERLPPRNLYAIKSEVLIDREWKNTSPRAGLEKVNGKWKLKWYSEMLRNCAADLCLSEGRAIHGQIIRNGTEPDSHLWVSLINFYAKCRALDSSRHVLDQMPIKDVVSWTALISGFVALGHGIESFELFCEMRRENVRPNEFTLATVLKGCSICLDLESGKQLHADVIKIGALSDVYVGSTLVDLYAKCGEMEYAENVFVMIPEQNAVLWNSLLNGYAQAGDGEAVLRLFCGMTESETRFSNYTLSIVLKGLAMSGDHGAGQAVHSMAIKTRGEHDDFICCSLVNMYSKCGQANDALSVFKRMANPDIVAWSTVISILDQQGQRKEAVELFHLMRNSGVRPNQYMKFQAIYEGHHVFNAMTHWDVVSWNALLSGFHDDEISNQGPKLFKHMLAEGFRPNMYTFISILRSCSSLLNVKFRKQVHAHVIKENFEYDGYIGTALIDMYAKCGALEDVEVVFGRLDEKDIFAWTVLISSYSQADQGEKAACCFNQMRREGVEPNEFTLASCLRACSGIASLENGRQLHSLVIKGGQSFDLFVASALIDMYGKCGCIEDAEILFYDMESGDTVLWNTIICEYSHHGQGEKALQAFRTMIEGELLPDEITFIGILSACSHMGLIEDGRKYFNSMSELYGITPSIEHYACMVDILGRAGKFDEVESFIKDMKLTPNALIWENVLGACRVHGNVELGERAAEKLFEIEPQTDSNYILLSNLYATKGRWDAVAKVRTSMSNKGIKKEPGCSWVEVDAHTHVFLSQDVSHPRLWDIHQKLEELRHKLTEKGYVPNTKYALQNVPDKEKSENLLHHSERIALGFALISKIQSEKIRIFKNLRICGDCHEFMKLVSGITNREIVVRDTRHFHHFQSGTCSCNDYW